MRSEVNEKSLAAKKAGRKRWQNVSAAARKTHAEDAVRAREAKRTRERTEAQARWNAMPARLKIALASALHLATYEQSSDGFRFAKDSARVYYTFGYTIGREGHCDGLGVNRVNLEAWNGLSASKSFKSIFVDSAMVATRIPIKRRGVFLRGLRDGAAGNQKSHGLHGPLTKAQLQARKIRSQARVRIVQAAKFHPENT